MRWRHIKAPCNQRGGTIEPAQQGNGKGADQVSARPQAKVAGACPSKLPIHECRNCRPAPARPGATARCAAASSPPGSCTACCGPGASSARKDRPGPWKSGTRTASGRACAPGCEPELADRRGRDPGRSPDDPLALDTAAVPARRGERRRDTAAQVPVARHAPRPPISPGARPPSP